MIDIATEQIVSLREAAGILPRRRRGRKPHVATLYRWSQHGFRGALLETCQVGGTRCTSIEAVQRFVNALTVAAVSPTQRVSTEPTRTHELAARELEAGGW